MAVRKTARTDQSDGGKAAGDGVEQKMVELAEQVGWFLGTVQAKAEGWLDRDVILKEVGRIRDGATDLLAHVNRASASARKAGAKAKAPSTMRASRGPASHERAPRGGEEPGRGASRMVDAPGKRHRKPPPQESIDKRMGEPVGKRMGQKSFKGGKSRGRG